MTSPNVVRPHESDNTNLLMTRQECLDKCKEFGFDQQITQEMLWNEAYTLGRKRWYWGPSWFVTFTGWVNTQINKLKSL